MPRIRAKRKKKVIAEDHRPPTACPDCGGLTTGGGLCTLCVKAQQAAVELEVNPPPPAPPPEPVPEPPKGIGPHPGCFRCGVEGRGMICGPCASVLFNLPGRNGDVKLVYPKPCGLTGW